MRPEDRAQASDPELVAELDRATGIFMTGGNQLKLSTVIAGTPSVEAIVDGPRARGHHRRHLGGGQHPVLAHGRVRSRRVHPQAADDPGRRAGSAWCENCVIDQHFAQRNRYGRLLMIVSQSPQLLGMGVDEDTAAVISRTARAPTS